MIYRSKKDSWLMALVSASILIPILIGLYSLLAPNGNHQVGWGALLVGMCTGLVVLLLTYPLYYELTPSGLNIRCGVFIRQQIPFSAIEEVRPTRNPSSAPAWSLDRLQINYRREGEETNALISPEDKGGFMSELVKRGAGLEMRGERVVRAA